MNDAIPRQRADRRQLQQIIAGLTEGVILVDPDQTIVWANEAALAMHGVEELQELGATVTEYRRKFELRYRNKHKLLDGGYPMDRVLAGEAFSDVIVEVARAGEEDPQSVHRNPELGAYRRGGRTRLPRARASRCDRALRRGRTL